MLSSANFILLKLFGLFPFDISSNCLVYNKKKFWISIFVTTFWWIFVFGRGFYHYRINHHNSANNLSVAEKARIFYVFATMVQSLVIIFTQKILVRDFLKLLRLVFKVLQTFKYQINLQHMQNMFFLNAVFEMCVTITYAYLFVYFRSNSKNEPFIGRMFIAIIFLYCNMVIISMHLLYFWIFGPIYQMQKTLNLQLKRSRDAVQLLILLKYIGKMRIYFKEIFTLANKIFGIQVLFYIGLYFVIFTENCFYITFNFSKNNIDGYAVIYIAWILFSAFKMLQLIGLTNGASFRVFSHFQFFSLNFLKLKLLTSLKVPKNYFFFQ